MASNGIHKCPFHNPRPAPRSNKDWWPNQLNLKVLSHNNNDPAKYGKSADLKSYAEEFKTVDLQELKQDLVKVMRTSQPWWPADWGHYGPFMIRMAWHSAGTYRAFDGRGGANSGNLRFAPLNSWPDNGNLDKARRLLWPIKQKWGRKVSWADLMIFAGNCAYEDMGLPMFGFAGGRVDCYNAEDEVDWGYENEWLADNARYTGQRQMLEPFGAVQMGLIYVNPEGPNACLDPLAAAHDIKVTFGRMSMNHEETVALIAGGHTVGKGHGAAAEQGPDPEGAALEEQGFGWTNQGKPAGGANTTTSGLEGAWTTNPTKWDHGYFTNLFKYEWEQVKTPAGATVWRPTDAATHQSVPEAHGDGKTWPVMYTTDLALKMDPELAVASKKFMDDPALFSDAFARAWYKLCHRDMGPVQRCLGNLTAPAQIWQDPVPAATSAPLSAADATALKGKIMAAGIAPKDLVLTAWASASTYRHTDHRGGANGARLTLAPQKDWEVNSGSSAVVSALVNVGKEFGKPVSTADLIVLGGAAGVEAAAKAAGLSVEVPFTGGRTDTTQELTDVNSFAVLEPPTDGFRNYMGKEFFKYGRDPAEMLIDRAHLLKLSAPEMTALVGGMRAMGATAAAADGLGVLTKTPGALDNAFFVNLLDMANEWSPVKSDGGDRTYLYEAKARGVAAGPAVWSASAVDLAFGSDSTLRAISEYYACSDSKEVFVADFVAAWTKVMMNDRFDL
jgi:catalase-peroxidase